MSLCVNLGDNCFNQFETVLQEINTHSLGISWIRFHW